MARIGKVMIKKLTDEENEIRSRIYFDGRIIGEMNSSLDEESPIEAVTLKSIHYLWRNLSRRLQLSFVLTNMLLKNHTWIR